MLYLSKTLKLTTVTDTLYFIVSHLFLEQFGSEAALIFYIKESFFALKYYYILL